MAKQRGGVSAETGRGAARFTECASPVLCTTQFLAADQERQSDVRRMQAMFPRIMSGDFEPLPSDVRPPTPSQQHCLCSCAAAIAE